MLPVNGKRRHVVVEERTKALREFAELDGNRIEWGTARWHHHLGRLLTST